MKVLTDEVIASFKDPARKLTGPKQGVPGPGDLGLLGREHLESGASVRLVSPYRGAGVERTAKWDHLPGKFLRSGGLRGT